MELLIANALRQVGEPIPFRLSEQIDAQEYCARSIVFAAPLTVQGQLVFDGKGFAVSAEAETVLRSVCARCAESFDESFAFSFSERFVKSAELAEDAEEECYTFEGDRITLDTALMDNLYLQLPLISVCREDCKGLCPVCGINRNESSCLCEQPKQGGPFAALSALDLED